MGFLEFSACFKIQSLYEVLIKRMKIADVESPFRILDERESMELYNDYNLSV